MAAKLACYRKSQTTTKLLVATLSGRLERKRITTTTKFRFWKLQLIGQVGSPEDLSNKIAGERVLAISVEFDNVIAKTTECRLYSDSVSGAAVNFC